MLGRGGDPQRPLLVPLPPSPALLWGYRLSPWFILGHVAEPKGFACRHTLTPSQAEHPTRTTTRTAACAGRPAGRGTSEPPSPRLGADGAFNSDLEFLLLALKSRKEEARRYLHSPAVLNGEEKPARARRFCAINCKHTWLRRAKVIPASRRSRSNLSVHTREWKENAEQTHGCP